MKVQMEYNLTGRQTWYFDYIRMTDDTELQKGHFIKDFVFQHRVRYMVYLRTSQSTKNKFIKLFCEYKLYRLCRKYGIEIKTKTKIAPGFVMIHPYNITISPAAEIGRNCNIYKGATIGLSNGKYPGAPQIGDSVQIGINSTVIGGIKVGNDVLIAPNTLVNRDIPDHSIVIGNPCKIIHRENATEQYVYYKV